MSPTPPEPGVQNERTALAWHRTALSVVVTAAIVTRLGMDSIGAAAGAALVVALPVAGWVVLVSRRRYQRRQGWSSGVHTRRRDGRLEFALAIVVVAMFVVLAAAVVL